MKSKSMSIERITITCILLLALCRPVSAESRRLLPADAEIGVEVSYDGERHVQQSVSGYRNLFFSGFALVQEVTETEEGAKWSIVITNDSKANIEIGSLWFSVSSPDSGVKGSENQGYCPHYNVCGDASYIYWCRYSGKDGTVLMTPDDGTSLEYVTSNDFSIPTTRYYIHGKWAAEPGGDWRIPLTSLTLAPGEKRIYSFRFERIGRRIDVDERIAEAGGLTVKVAPGLVIAKSKEVLCAFNCKDGINAIKPEFPNSTKIVNKGKNAAGKEIVAFEFRKKGENQVVIDYGSGKKAYLEFFVTEPIDRLIRKRSDFITGRQQVLDTSKWYDGLYSLWDMKTGRLLTPDFHHHLPDFCVGGSDDPSNCKPLYVSEKNVFYPNRKEIAALEYYEDHFVKGKLQRTADESPYPYGIYGSDNWYKNRSGECGGWDSGGWGLQRLWRTFDYTTHIAIYYNLYLIASGDASLTKHPASYWLEMAYNTTKAFFTVPYNIYMKGFAFTGWCDWAYKQGNFHERYIIDLIDALAENGLVDRAEEIRHEWEKKVLYFIYEDPWPFASEFPIDRTAYESSYYIADYGCRHYIEPRKNLWQDKNSLKWYSYDSYDFADAKSLMNNQLSSNLAMRSICGTSYWNLGTAWANTINLDYMSQMGGAAILDYAFRYSDDPARFINYGYNSLISSWALINTGYWYPSARNNGAAGWEFSETENAWKFYFEMISRDRGPFRYDGEIDHGFTGGVHAAGTYVVNDPDFGLLAYGGDVSEKDGIFSLHPDDGICRRVFFTTPVRAGIELRQDAFDPKTPVQVSSDGSVISFVIENRYGSPHSCNVKLWAFPQGEYEIAVNGKTIAANLSPGSDSDMTFSFELDKKACVTIANNNIQ